MFSCVGLSGAFLTVLCWFPWLDRKPLKQTRFATRFAASLDRWPRWPRGWRGMALALGGMALLASGVLKLRSVDDVRTLQNAPPALIAEQIEVARILGLASPAQVFLVSGADSDELLRHEENLTARLAALVKAGTIAGYQALSDWVPSTGTQQANAELVADANRKAWRAVATTTGEPIDIAPVEPRLLAVADLAPVAQGLPAISEWQASGMHHTLVMLQGLDRASLPALSQAAAGLPGVRFIDNTARYSGLLSHYRLRLSGLLLLGLAAVVAAIALALRPQCLARLAADPAGRRLHAGLLRLGRHPHAAVRGAVADPAARHGHRLWHLHAEHPGERSVWLAVAIAGISTLLSFGLLALSSTPALRAFGLAMLIGETSIWLLTPVFRAETRHS